MGARKAFRAPIRFFLEVKTRPVGKGRDRPNTAVVARPSWSGNSGLQDLIRMAFPRISPSRAEIPELEALATLRPDPGRCSQTIPGLVTQGCKP
jgi:hypothetical protein